MLHSTAIAVRGDDRMPLYSSDGQYLVPMPPPPPVEFVGFIDSVLARTYQEPASLLGVATAGPGRPRSTERAIVARMAIHAAALMAPTFSGSTMIDVEYERVGGGREAKRRDRRKISPDLILHERLNPQANFLVVEVKCLGHNRRRGWTLGPEVGDLCKIGFFTNELERQEPRGMTSYEWGLCIELDSAGANQWWVTRQLTPMNLYELNGELLQGPDEGSVHFRRWNR